MFYLSQILTNRFIISLRKYMSYSKVLTSHAYSDELSVHYRDVPINLTLQKVVVIHRHGDRSQISKGFYPDSIIDNNLTKFWINKMPFRKKGQQEKSEALSLDLAERSSYFGQDRKEFPYGMLTEKGVSQLITVGKVLNKRYVGSFLPNDIDEINKYVYCRSTNYCRTILSLQSLLHGFYGKSAINNNHILPTFEIRLKKYENLYPQSYQCKYLIERRIFLLNNLHLNLTKSISDYEIFNLKIKNLFGYADRVDWITLKEILTAHDIHHYTLPRGIDSNDINKITHISSVIWGILFQDPSFNRFAIGRFLRELLSIIDIEEHSKHCSSQHASRQPKMFIFSGHDATLAPVLAALGVHIDHWPPYASNLTIETARDQTGGSWARLLYNDLELSLDPQQASAWAPLSLLKDRLGAQAISDEEYAAHCL